MTEYVAATNQNQVLNVIVFLDRVVLQQELVGIDAVWTKKSRLSAHSLDARWRAVSHLPSVIYTHVLNRGSRGVWSPLDL